VPGNEDDIRIGFMPATWSVKPFDEVAAEDNDVKYAGVMDARIGMFTPGDAGPNPERKMSANNVGNLKVVGTVKDGDTTASGEGRLVVSAPLLIALPLQ
jgi:quinohemoprotein amine dehydrogenase